MRSSLSLRTRFVVAIVSLVALICGGFYFAVYQFVEVLEEQLSEATVRRELREMHASYQAGKALHYLEGQELRGFVVQRGAATPSGLPPEVLSWPSGQYDEIQFNGHGYFAGREDAGDTALFMVLDMARVDALETRLVGIAYVAILSALAAAVLVGYALSLLVLRPVSQISDQLARSEPEAAPLRLSDRFPDREIGLIAAAFDRYQSRIERFVARERAFTDDASHELRTPLATILSALPLLQANSSLSALDRERLARIERGARQMHALIDALLALARETQPGAMQACVLDDLVREVADLHRPAIEAKGLELRLRIDQRVTVKAGPGLVAAVIGNLVGNAVQNTEQGYVEVGLGGDRVWIEDSGPGIAPDEQAKIFERRYRGAHSKGLGIGLYLVARICERLQWRIDVESSAQRGTRFVLRLGPSVVTKS